MAFHMDKCLHSKAQKMLDPHQCATYRFAQHTAMQTDPAYTFQDALRSCERDVMSTTSADLWDLCSRVSGAYGSSSIIRKWTN